MKVTKHDVDSVISSLNEQLIKLNQENRLYLGHRNGTSCLDLYDDKGNMRDNLINGTKTIIYAYLQGMQRAMRLL